MGKTLAFVTLVLMMSSASLAARCDPDTNCKPPNCRCWEDRNVPGNLKPMEAPQIVLLSFGNSIDRYTKKFSMEMMQDLYNPNGCPGMATFFIEKLNTDPEEVLSLYNMGFEVALSTMNDTLPQSPTDWLQNVGRVKSLLTRTGIPADSLKGFRSAQLFAGGDEALDILTKLGVQYDTTCVNKQYVQRSNTKWPYTYDFPSHAPKCGIGKTPMKEHNGTWQFLVADLIWGNRTCPSPSACAPEIKTAEETFQFLFSNFLNHYNGNRAPFNLYLDPLWPTYPHHVEGTREFLEFLGALSDTWLLTFQQALDWMKRPCNKKTAHTFPTWGCRERSKKWRQGR